jgi:hypothetical protein
MPTELERRAALLAVSRFGADAARVQAAWQETLRARERGLNADFLESLVQTEMLTQAQAAELREALDKTQIALRDDSAPAAGDLRVRTPVSPEPLRIVGGCRILRKLGEGGMGAVYLAYQEDPGRQVAIKILADHLSRAPSLVERFEREALHSSKLDHPNIVRGLGVGKDEKTGQHYLIMEYVDGPSAQHLLDEYGKVDIGDAVRIIKDIAQALEHVQSRNIIHRDIKPENILITRTGVAKLADLGLAKQTDQASHLTQIKQGFGTPYYIPPEQARDARRADGRSDIYALGATFYHLLTGQVPFPGQAQIEILEKKAIGSYPPASLLNSRIPEALDRILDKMLACDPRDRYQTASELIVDLERSGLSSPLLSFVDHDLALKDPLVRARAVGVGLTTQPDLNGPIETAPKEPEFWFIRLYDKNGKWRQLKATAAQVLKQIEKGRLNGMTRAAHFPDGPYRQLDVYPAFRSAIREVERDARSAKRAHSRDPLDEVESDELPMSRAWQVVWLAAGAGLAALAVIGVAYLIGS